jgi:hypothetical protein
MSVYRAAVHFQRSDCTEHRDSVPSIDVVHVGIDTGAQLIYGERIVRVIIEDVFDRTLYPS